MVVNDCQTDFKRIERGANSEGNAERDHQLDSDSKSIGESRINSAVKHMGNTRHSHRQHYGTNRQTNATFYWQSYPSSPFTTRVDWVIDVFTSFRGMGWNWQSSGVPPIPKMIGVGLDSGHDINTDLSRDDMTVSHTGIHRHAKRADVLRDAAICIPHAYLTLDIIVTLMHRDPYFWGYINAAPPAYLPSLLRQSAVLTQSYRLLLSLAGVYTALWGIFKLGPIFFCGILGPRWLGLRGEAWMNPLDMFGSFRSVLDKGLAGWWGAWWHQIFRFGFEAPATALLQTWGIEKRSTTGRLVAVIVAFTLSGLVHAAGSHTQLGDTRPISRSFSFFILQALAIITQTAICVQLKTAGIISKCPKILRQLTNFAFVHIWLYYTAPLLMDDFSQGGVWLFEPIPFSILRGLGLGAPGDQFFCWWGEPARWQSGKHWWATGIAM
jgi:hypothetical protein